MSHIVKHLALRAIMVDSQIRSEQRSRWPDSLRLSRLKKLRLMIKDKIQKIVRRETTKNKTHIPYRQTSPKGG
jgi:hypothetical protein